MTEVIQWENGIVSLPLNAPLAAALDQAGKDGWEPWAVMSADDNTIRIAVKRHKRAITLATTMPTNGIINN